MTVPGSSSIHIFETLQTEVYGHFGSNRRKAIQVMSLSKISVVTTDLSTGLCPLLSLSRHSRIHQGLAGLAWPVSAGNGASGVRDLLFGQDQHRFCG